MIHTILSYLTGVLVIFPFIIIIFISLFYKGLGVKPVFKKVADITTLFLFFSVYMIAKTIFGEGVGYFIIISALVTTISYAIFERRRVKEFQIIRLFRKVWRLFFLMLIAAYILLIIIGIFFKVIEHVL